MSKPRLLIHSLIFPPDQVSTAYLYGDIAQGFIDEGWDVEVFTTTPHYNFEKDFSKQSKRRFLHFETDFHGARVVHIPQKKSNSGLTRGLYLLWFHFTFFIRAFFGRSFDVILSPSPPPTIGLINGLIAKLKGVKAVYNVQEIYPDILLKARAKMPLLLMVLLRWAERKTYQWNSKVVTIDEQFAEVIRPRIDNYKLEVIPNFVDTRLYCPQPYLRNTRLDFNGKFLVVYLGNLGKVQDWETLLNCAKKLIAYEKIQFLLIGGGSEYKNLKRCSKSLPNLDVWSYQEREMVPQIIARSNLHVISMDEASDYDGLPSKVLTILSSGKPILLASDMGTPVSRVVTNSGNGIRVDRGDAKSMAREIIAISEGERSEELDHSNGRRYILNSFSKEVVIGRYEKLLQQLLKH